MDKRFFNFFNLTEEQAIALLDTPQAQISENDSRYILHTAGGPRPGFSESNWAKKCVFVFAYQFNSVTKRAGSIKCTRLIQASTKIELKTERIVIIDGSGDN